MSGIMLVSLDINDFKMNNPTGQSEAYQVPHGGNINASMSYYIAEDWEQYTEQKITELCDDCQLTFPDLGQFLEVQDEKHNSYRYETNLMRVESAATNRCPFCSLLLMAIKYKIKNAWGEDQSVGVLTEKTRGGLQVFFSAGENDEWRSAMEFAPATKLDPGISTQTECIQKEYLLILLKRICLR